MPKDNLIDIPELKIPHVDNADEFRLAALAFERNGFYCPYPPGTTAYMRFWDEELKRCIHGYTTPSGKFVSGYYYFYLNYSRIIVTKERVVTDKRTGKIPRGKRF